MPFGLKNTGTTYQIDGPNFQTADRTKHQGLHQRHGCQVSKHSPTHGKPGRGLWRAPQIRHVP